MPKLIIDGLVMVAILLTACLASEGRTARAYSFSSAQEYIHDADGNTAYRQQYLQWGPWVGNNTEASVSVESIGQFPSPYTGWYANSWFIEVDGTDTGWTRYSADVDPYFYADYNSGLVTITQSPGQYVDLDISARDAWCDNVDHCYGYLTYDYGAYLKSVIPRASTTATLCVWQFPHYQYPYSPC
jgi:hypothetical protein